MLLDEMVNDAIEAHICADVFLVIANNAEVFDRGRRYHRANPFAQSEDLWLRLHGRVAHSKIPELAEVGYRRWFL
jgi:hypothetical protein